MWSKGNRHADCISHSNQQLALSKENSHFDDQSIKQVFLCIIGEFYKKKLKTCSLCFYRVTETQVEVWEDFKKLRTNSPVSSTVTTVVLILPNFHSNFYNLMKMHTSTCVFYFLNRWQLHGKVLTSHATLCSIWLQIAFNSSLCKCLIANSSQSYDFAKELFSLMSSSRKYPYSPHRRDWNFPGVGVL